MRIARRILVIWAIDALALWILAQIIPGLELTRWVWAIWAIAVVGLLNALLRPLLLVVMLPFTILTMGLLSLVLNAVILLAADAILPGFVVADLIAALWAVMGLAAINTVATSLLSINDDESFYRNVILRLARRTDNAAEVSAPGLVMLEIDGLSESTLRRALDLGYMPTLRSWVEGGRIRITPWDCGLPSQTSSSQSGILYGRTVGIPAFRWYEKENRRLMISNRPWTAAEIHRRVSDGTGLLAPNGASLTNLVSGDAGQALMTMSALLDGRRSAGGRGKSYFLYFLNPYSFARTLVLMIWEILREIGQRLWMRIRQGRSAHTRGGSFPLLRAVSNVFLRDLNLYMLIERMLSGTPVVYSTFLGYDVVAHHVGPNERAALVTLRQFDDGLAALERAASRAPRPYHLVLLSDHGQSFGATFEQRYGITLEALVGRSLEGRESVTGPAQDDEAWSNLNLLLTEAIQEETVAGRAARRMLRGRTQDGYVDFGPGSDEVRDPRSDVVVCTSGNLALVYFTDVERRLTLEELVARYPRLVSTLAGHKGIGFVLVHSQTSGPVAIGARGINYLAAGVVEGDDPLVPFGPGAAKQLRKLDSYPYVGDLLINSRYDPESDEVAAFESLVGSHGGLGGDQTRAFLAHPATWSVPEDAIAGPEEVHLLLRRWISEHVSEPAAPHEPVDSARTPVAESRSGE